MTRIDVTKATRLLYRGLNFRMVERRGDDIDWTCDRNNERETFTDAELVEMIGDGRASFQGIGGNYEPEPLPDPEDTTPEAMAIALRKLDYVEAVRAAKLPRRPNVDQYDAVIATVAENRGEVSAPEGV